MPTIVDEILKENIEELRDWLSQTDVVPPKHSATIAALCRLHEYTCQQELKKKSTVARLRESMGISPKSERGAQEKDSPYTGNKDLKARYQERFLRRRLSRSGDEKKLENLFDEAKINENFENRKQDVRREEHFKSNKGLRSDRHTRTIWDLKLVLTKIVADVETVYDPISDKRVTAEVDYAPPGANHTYDTIALLVHLHVAYLIPTQRLARMFSSGSKTFSSSLVCSFVHNLAECLLPVYLEMAKVLGQDVNYFQVDDTKPRVLEEKKPGQKESAGPLVKLLDDELHTDFTRKGLNLSVVSGKADESDEYSRIIFFRTHRSSVGKFLNHLVEKYASNPKRPIVVLQDLSSQSTPSRLNATVAGCAAHARRPFWRHRELDPDLTYNILRCFAVLSEVEHRLAQASPEKILGYRKRYGRKIWSIIIKTCHKILGRWPPSSELGIASRYIINNEQRLLYYLTDAKLPWTNNLSERLLRPEKIMLANSKFRATLEGRAALDILTSIMATARAAGVNWNAYAIAIMKNKDLVMTHPEEWLPHIYKKHPSRQF